MLVRIVIGGVLAAAVAWSAHRARALSTSGAIAATAVGIAAVSAGWGWGALLVVYFVSSTLIGRWRHADRASIVHGVTDKGGRRDAVQVLANGGVFAIAAVAWSVRPGITLAAAAAGALAAAAADTWATEVGTLAGGEPRSLLSGKRIARGMSGGVTWAGTLATAFGALLLGAAALGLGWPLRSAIAGAAGGVAGSVVDSLAGGVLQERRWCESCRMPTERLRHDCGNATVRTGGVPGVRNDAVNLACTLAGAAVAAWLASSR
jgi:uncharacterized protein (TIGR00297 family)